VVPHRSFAIATTHQRKSWVLANSAHTSFCLCVLDPDNSPHPAWPGSARPAPGHPYHWEGQRDALAAERWIARGLGDASGVHIRNAGSMHILPGNCVKAPLPGAGDYEERMRGMDHLAGFYVYLLLTVV